MKQSHGLDCFETATRRPRNDKFLFNRLTFGIVSFAIFISPIASALEPKEIPALINQLTNKNSFVRGQAADKLGVLRHAPAVPLLGKLLVEDSALYVRQSAAIALMFIGDPAALPFLVRGLSDKEPAVVRSSAKALSIFKDPSALPHFETLLSNGNRQTKLVVFETLREMPREATKPLLEKTVTAEKDNYMRLTLNYFVQGITKVSDEGISR